MPSVLRNCSEQMAWVTGLQQEDSVVARRLFCSRQLLQKVQSRCKAPHCMRPDALSDCAHAEQSDSRSKATISVVERRLVLIGKPQEQLCVCLRLIVSAQDRVFVIRFKLMAAISEAMRLGNSLSRLGKALGGSWQTHHSKIG